MPGEPPKTGPARPTASRGAGAARSSQALAFHHAEESLRSDDEDPEEKDVKDHGRPVESERHAGHLLGDTEQHRGHERAAQAAQAPKHHDSEEFAEPQPVGGRM